MCFNFIITFLDCLLIYNSGPVGRCWPNIPRNTSQGCHQEEIASRQMARGQLALKGDDKNFLIDIYKEKL